MKIIKRIVLTLLSGVLMTNIAMAKEITDMVGRKVTIPDKPKKVYAPSPYGSYALYAIDPTLVAGWIFDIKDADKVYLHKSMQNIPVIGSIFGKGQTANVENLFVAKPDLILMWASQKTAFDDKASEKLKLLNIPSVYAVAENLSDYPNTLLFLGKALNREERAKKLADYTVSTFESTKAVVSKIPQNKRPKVYYAEGVDGLATECDDSIHVELLKMAGDVDVHKCHTSNHKGFEKVSIEQIAIYNPDVIVVQEKEFFDKVYTNPMWKNIKAVKNKRVYLIPKAPFNWFDRPPSFMRIMGLKWLMHNLYPNEYKIDINKETKEFYRLFMGVELTDKQTKEILFQ